MVNSASRTCTRPETAHKQQQPHINLKPIQTNIKTLLTKAANEEEAEVEKLFQAYNKLATMQLYMVIKYAVNMLLLLQLLLLTKIQQQLPQVQHTLQQQQTQPVTLPLLFFLLLILLLFLIHLKQQQRKSSLCHYEQQQQIAQSTTADTRFLLPGVTKIRSLTTPIFGTTTYALHILLLFQQLTATTHLSAGNAINSPAQVAADDNSGVLLAIADYAQYRLGTNISYTQALHYQQQHQKQQQQTDTSSKSKGNKSRNSTSSSNSTIMQRLSLALGVTTTTTTKTTTSILATTRTTTSTTSTSLRQHQKQKKLTDQQHASKEFPIPTTAKKQNSAALLAATNKSALSDTLLTTTSTSDSALAIAVGDSDDSVVDVANRERSIINFVNRDNILKHNSNNNDRRYQQHQHNNHIDNKRDGDTSFVANGSINWSSITNVYKYGSNIRNRCLSCQMREKAKLDSLESIKFNILMRLQLSQLPNITAPIAVPDNILESFYRNYNMTRQQQLREEIKTKTTLTQHIKAKTLSRGERVSKAITDSNIEMVSDKLDIATAAAPSSVARQQQTQTQQLYQPIKSNTDKNVALARYYQQDGNKPTTSHVYNERVEYYILNANSNNDYKVNIDEDVADLVMQNDEAIATQHQHYENYAASYVNVDTDADSYSYTKLHQHNYNLFHNTNNNNNYNDNDDVIDTDDGHIYNRFSESYNDNNDNEEDVEYLPRIDSVYMFPTIPHMRHTHNVDILNFKFESNHSTILRSVLHVYIRGRDWIRDYDASLLNRKQPDGTVENRRDIIVIVYRAIRRSNSLNFTHSVKLTESRQEIPSGLGQWVQIEVNELSKHWMQNCNATQSIIIKGLKSWMHPFIVTNGESVKNKLLTVHIEVLTRDKSRRKRSTSLDCQESDHEVRCCRYPLKVNFTNFGWHFVVAPTSFDAYFCNGECKVGYLEQYTHTHIASLTTSATPCCSPTKMSSLSLLYFNLDHNLVLSTIPNMSVEKCSCS